MKQFTVKARVGAGTAPENIGERRKILDKFVLQDEEGVYSLIKESNLVRALLSNKASVVNARILDNKIDVVGDSVPLIYEEDCFCSLDDPTLMSQMIELAKENIRTVKAVVREGDSHVSGYLLDNDFFIDIYYDEQFAHSYTNAVVDEKGIIRVKHEEDLPDIEVDSIILPHSNPKKITPASVNTGSSSRLKFYRDPINGIETMKNLAAVLGDEWHTAPPLDFYDYVPTRFVKYQKVTTCLRCTLTLEGKKWIEENRTYFPVPKPLSALHGIPVITYKDVFQDFSTISRSSFHLWDEHQLPRTAVGRWINKSHNTSSTIMMGGGRHSHSEENESRY